MATPMPPVEPISRKNQPPALNFNPNSQQNPDPLANKMGNLNLNHPPPVPGGPTRPPQLGQSPPFRSTAAPMPSVRPDGPPRTVVEPAGFPPGPPPSTLPLNVALGRPARQPGSQPPPFGSRPPPPGSLPSSMSNPVVPLSRPPPVSSPLLGFSSGPVASVLPGARPGPVVSSPFPPGSVAPVTPGALVSNGPPMVASGGFPAAMVARQPSYGAPQTMTSAQAPGMRTPSVSSALGPQSGPTFQMSPPFTAAPQGVPPPSFGPQTWQAQPRQVFPPPPISGSAQPPRMFGMQPPLPNQMMAMIPPGQPGAPMAVGTKIDPTQVPRPIPNSSVILHETRQGNQANPPPPSTCEYIIRDTGNCNPRFMRCTINQIPCTADLLKTSAMQMALLVQPLALPHPSEDPIQIVDLGETGPVRCSRCKGYMNPFMKFIDQGRRFICNFCGFSDETPHGYQCNLGPDGRRRDADERPELCRGTVEYVASKEFMVRDPMPAVYFFLIDVSMNAIQTGATAAACRAISQVISDLPESSRTMVGIATFDSTIHFYNLKHALQQPLMLIVPDVEEVYTPLQTDVVVQLSECRQHIELLLETIPEMFRDNKTAESAFGAGIKAAFLAIKSTGGKLLVFQSVLPSVGIGALSAREAEESSKISAGDKEAHKLLQPADRTLKTMAIELAEYQVCVDLFITSQTYVDIASISVIPRTTGGQVYYYYPFSAVSDSAKLYNDLRWNITRPQGLEAVMRVRCSQGIQVQEYYGNFCKRIPTDIDLPGIDCDKTIMVTLTHDDKLQDGSECAFQSAILYTNLYGQRRIRVSTLSLPCTSAPNNLFRTADLDAQFSCFLKKAASEIPTRPLLTVREEITNLCIGSLLSYRKFCATVSSSGQLILPEALKLLPLYTLALLKSTGLRNDGRIDDRSFWITYISSLPTQLAIAVVYPRMFAVHNICSNEEGSLIPTALPLSSEELHDEGIYLLENGEDCLIYVGDLVNPDILRHLFGISSVDEIPTQFVLKQFDNPLSEKLNDVINEIRRQRCSYLRVKLCKKGDPSGILFLSYMIEEKSPNGPSYIDFLIHVHRQIQTKMS